MENKVNIVPSLQSITIIARDHKRTDFHPEKIAIAIKKGFDSLNDSNYSDQDSFLVYQHVIDQLATISLTQSSLSIEEIQDTIEKQLLKLGYEDVYESFASYRLRRSESRKVFMSSQHKFLKAIENLSFNEDDHDNPSQMLVDFGSVISRQFARAYLVDAQAVSLHDDGFIHIHHLPLYPLATTSSFVVPLDKLIDDKVTDFSSALNQISLVIELLQKEHHGQQAIDDFDEGLVVGVLASFKRCFIQLLDDYQAVVNQSLPRFEACKKQVSKLNSIDVDLSAFEKYFNEDNVDALSAIYEQSLKYLETEIFSMLSQFLQRHRQKDKLDLSLNIGLSTSKEGRLVAKQLLLAMSENPEYPYIIFKCQDGINLEFEDLNYDLLTLALDLANVSDVVMFQNVNKEKASYLPNGIKIGQDVHQENDTTLSGRGLLSLTSINLVRLKILNMDDESAFVDALKDLVKQVINQLLDRYEFQYDKKIDYFPTLMGQQLYLESDKLKKNHDLSRALRHGLLGINLVGLSQVDSDLVLSVVNKMIKKATKKYQLNFGLVALDFEDVSMRFQELDQLIYGRREGINDVFYTNGDIEDQDLVSSGHKLVVDEFMIDDKIGFFQIKSNKSDE